MEGHPRYASSNPVAEASARPPFATLTQSAGTGCNALEADDRSSDQQDPAPGGIPPQGSQPGGPQQGPHHEPHQKPHQEPHQEPQQGPHQEPHQEPQQGAQGERPVAQREDVHVSGKAWKPWEICIPWLLFILFVDIAFILTIVVLSFVSKRNHGFVGLGDAPGFLARDPAVEKAIWAQGIFYTALPAFIMTVFQTCWNTAVAAYAKRQPYVELKAGGSAKKTIMLEYTAPFALSCFEAFKNEHYILAACMLSTTTLVFLVVPLTSFLFTTSQPILNSTLDLSVETAFNTSILGQYPSYPNLRFMDTAAAIHVEGASPPAWTDGHNAFPSVTILKGSKGGNVSFESVAYSAEADCVHLEEGSYRKIIQRPEDTGIPALTVSIFANDRGCQIMSSSNFRANTGVPLISVNSWATTTCPAYAGWSRFSLLVARVQDNYDISNFSLISCIPRYRTSFGSLTTNWKDNSDIPSMESFQVTNISGSSSDAVWRFFEMGLQSPGCFDPGSDIDANEFGRQVYRLAAHRAPKSALLPKTIIDSAETLFATMYSIFASLYLLQPTDMPNTTVGTISVQPTRLIVVTPIACIIVGILVLVAGLDIALLKYGDWDVPLEEEPKGLLGIAAILYGSADIMTVIEEIRNQEKYQAGPCRGRVCLTALHDPPENFTEDVWKFKGRVLRRNPSSDRDSDRDGHALNNLNRDRQQRP